MGNIKSVLHSVKRYTGDVTIASSGKELDAAEKIILPGVGAFKDGCDELKQRGMFDDISNFGNRIKKIGDEYSIKILQIYGEDLIFHVSSFDIEKMSNTLDSYPDVIEKIRTLIQELT